MKRAIKVGDLVIFDDAHSTGYKNGDVVRVTEINYTANAFGFICPNANVNAIGERQYERVIKGGQYWDIGRVSLISFQAKLRRKRV